MTAASHESDPDGAEPGPRPAHVAEPSTEPTNPTAVLALLHTSRGPSKRSRHRENVPTSVLERSGSIVSVGPAAIASEIAYRPRGGARRADGDPLIGEVGKHIGALVRSHEASRIALNSDGALIDAFDAAEFIARRADHWDASQVLAHNEIARLAAKEAHDRLARHRRRTPNRWWSLPGNRRLYSALGDEQALIAHCLRLLTEVQTTGWLDGY